MHNQYKHLREDQPGRILIYNTGDGDWLTYARTFPEAINALQGLFEHLAKWYYSWLDKEPTHKPGPMGTKNRTHNYDLIIAYRAAKQHNLDGLLAFFTEKGEGYGEGDFRFETVLKPDPSHKWEL